MARRARAQRSRAAATSAASGAKRAASHSRSSSATPRRRVGSTPARSRRVDHLVPDGAADAHPGVRDGRRLERARDRRVRGARVASLRRPRSPRRRAPSAPSTGDALRARHARDDAGVRPRGPRRPTPNADGPRADAERARTAAGRRGARGAGPRPFQRVAWSRADPAASPGRSVGRRRRRRRRRLDVDYAERGAGDVVALLLRIPERQRHLAEIDVSRRCRRTT